MTGSVATNGDFVPAGCPENYVYNTDGTIKSITTNVSGANYVETFIYVGGQMTGTSGLVAQP